METYGCDWSRPNKSMEARRFFFRNLARRTHRLSREATDHRYVPLRSLPNLDDSRLREVVPVLADNENAEWKIGAAKIHRWNSSTDSWDLFRELSPTESMIIRMILFSIPLSEIATRLASVSDLTDAEAWAVVKKLFLEFAEAGFCHPACPPDTERGGV
jgi:hypothetical protein